ncbi:phage tail protein [Pseudomonas sp. ADAK18]|uniref:phage tail protein n=1 Tax=Pseudomonas sp. ADAK18 TaxID=2730848 RepID=UPI0014631F9D|nr:phage tail protein [Pseudomonas sp. ADAK18]QJI29910.1 phage tail protein [Pseudomonas sp. ADAK18]
MAVFLPNGSTAAIAGSYDAPIIFTAITNATEAVVSSAGHDLEVGDFVEVTSGWARLNNRIARVKTVTTDSFVLEKINTFNSARFIAGAGGGSVRKILTWVPMSQVTESNKSGGEQQNVTYSFLEEDDEHQIPTSKSPLSFTLTMADDPELPHNEVLLEADDDKKPRAVRVNLASGGVIAYNAYASFDSVPSLTKNNIMAVTAVFAVVAKFIRYGA